MHVWAASYLYMHVHPFLFNLLSLSSDFLYIWRTMQSLFSGVDSGSSVSPSSSSPELLSPALVAYSSVIHPRLRAYALPLLPSTSHYISSFGLRIFSSMSIGDSAPYVAHLI